MADMPSQLADRSGAPIERPLPLPSGNALFGSDVVAETLRALEIPFIALNPGASYRGFHDSLVNHLGNVQPQMLLCLHEEHAVAIAHGYAKVTGKPMAAVASFQCRADARHDGDLQRLVRSDAGAGAGRDRAGGCAEAPPVDRLDPHRPGSGRADPPYTKWDDQPASPEAAREALLRACWLTQTAPMGPVYVNLDAGMQEATADAIRCRRSMLRGSCLRCRRLLRRSRSRRRWRCCGGAERPVILMGRGSRDEQAWANRVALAEVLRRTRGDRSEMRRGVSDRPSVAAGAPATFPVEEAAAAIKAADVVLSLDWVDLAGSLKAACGTARTRGEGDQCDDGSSASQRLEHGPSGVASRRCIYCRAARTRWSRRCWRNCRAAMVIIRSARSRWRDRLSRVRSGSRG